MLMLKLHLSAIDHSLGTFADPRKWLSLKVLREVPREPLRQGGLRFQLAEKYCSQQ